MQQENRRSILMVAGGLDPVGTGRQIELAAVGFRDAGWNVHVAVTTLGGTVPARLAQNGFEVHAVGRRAVVDLGAGTRLARLARRIGPAVVLAWGRSQARLVGCVRSLLLGSRVVCQVANGPRDTFTGWALRRADRVIVVSAGVAGRCEAVGVRSGRIDIIPPGIVADAGLGLARQEIARRLGLRMESPWTLCVAPLVSESRLERLLWGIDQLDVVHRGVEHVLVGSGPLRPRLGRWARLQHLAERLHFVASCDCLPDLLREVRLVWQSGSVAYGGAILDAMPLGIPAVAVASDAARQLIVDQETGRVVLPEPESEFPRRAMNIIEDESLAARYGAAARTRAAEHFPLAASIQRQIEAVERAAR
jgi:glycosyltransferase involved in cell wall biosynthesis